MRTTLTGIGKNVEVTLFLLPNLHSLSRASFHQKLRQSWVARECENLVCRISAPRSLKLGRLRLRQLNKQPIHNLFLCKLC